MRLIQLIICQQRILQMQSLPNQTPYMTFVLYPSTNTYVTFLPTSSEIFTSHQHQIASPFFYAPQIDSFAFGEACLQRAGQFSGNLQQYREMSQASHLVNIIGNQVQKAESAAYSPIVLSSNRESSFHEKSSDSPKTENPSQKQPKRPKSKNAPSEQDREYNPQASRKRKPASKYQENQNRNIVPNEINQIFSFLQKRNKSGHLVEKLLQKFDHPQHYTPKRYYLYQSLLKNRLGHYTNQKSLKLISELYEPKCESWPEQEQRFYNKISRVLICHFLQEDSIFIILTSKRMKAEKKGEHLRVRRFIKQSVLRILRGC